MKIWDVNCTEDINNSTHKIGKISLKLNLEIEPILIYPTGVNKSIGFGEFRNTEFDTRIT